MIQYDILIQYNIKFNYNLYKRTAEKELPQRPYQKFTHLLTHTDREHSNTGPLNP
jgi:hypothetical protein